MKKRLLLVRDDRGTAAIEMAIALPVIILFVWGIFQLGIAFQANAGMQHALGEGARLATICQDPTAAGVCSTATDEEIEDRVSEKLFGTGLGEFDVAVSRPADDPSTPADESDVNWLDLTATFTMPTNFLFFDGPTLNLEQSKRVYIA